MDTKNNDTVDFNDIENKTCVDVTDAELVSIVEALLFASGEAVSLKKLAEVAGVGLRRTKKAVTELSAKYSACGGIALFESEEGFRLATKKEYSDYIDRMFGSPKRRGLSSAALEVLAIIALRQPVTRAEIEEMRGANPDSLVQQLLKKELIYCSGKLDKLGNPGQYSTTAKFLEMFELKSLGDLPPIEDFILF